jgi:hypothetical protein
MKKLDNLFMVCMGAGMLYASFFAIDDAACGEQIMSTSDKCITTSYRGSSVSSHTSDYMEQRHKNRVLRLCLVGGGVFFLLGGLGIFDGKRPGR